MLKSLVYAPTSAAEGDAETGLTLSMLRKKAETYVDSALLEIGASLDIEHARELQCALVDDFIQIYNLGRQAPHDLPGGKTICLDER
jgi:hypothetical protein